MAFQMLLRMFHSILRVNTELTREKINGWSRCLWAPCPFYWKNSSMQHRPQKVELWQMNICWILIFKVHRQNLYVKFEFITVYVAQTVPEDFFRPPGRKRWSQIILFTICIVLFTLRVTARTVLKAGECNCKRKILICSQCGKSDLPQEPFSGKSVSACAWKAGYRRYSDWGRLQEYWDWTGEKGIFLRDEKAEKATLQCFWLLRYY